TSGWIDIGLAHNEIECLQQDNELQQYWRTIVSFLSGEPKSCVSVDYSGSNRWGMELAFDFASLFVLTWPQSCLYDYIDAVTPFSELHANALQVMKNENV
ncbi:MAG TPA: hypothetical protein VF719_06105, partial [Abditibacteriaceae bacterium]